MKPDPRRVYFLCDAGPGIGGGHVMRCLTLASALSRSGTASIFASTPGAAPILDAFGTAVERHGLPAGSPSALAAGAANDAVLSRASVIVVDHYGVGLADEKSLRKSVPHLVAVDDLCRPHDCDLVLDSNLGRTAKDYPGTEVLAGPSFAPVREEFTTARVSSLARRESRPGVKRVLISLGLTDVSGITGRVAAALQPVLGERQLDVVVGTSAPSLFQLHRLADFDKRVTTHVNTHEMAELTSAADLAIGAGGSTTWERCCLGLPAITVVLAENQRANATELAHAGASLVMDAREADFEQHLATAFTHLAESGDLLATMGSRSAALCDGRGADRVAERLLRLAAS